NNLQALISFNVGGNGNFANNPSGFTTAFLFNSDTDVLNVPAGFDTGFSFFYVAVNPNDLTAVAGSVAVYDGLNGTGNLLGTLNLLPTPLTPFPGPTYSTWVPIGVGFSGTAESVVFNGYANYLGLDNVTLGSSTPAFVPESSPFAPEL